MTYSVDASPHYCEVTDSTIRLMHIYVPLTSFFFFFFGGLGREPNTEKDKDVFSRTIGAKDS